LWKTFNFNLRRIRSHIESTSAGRLPIQGNIKADILAVSARRRSYEKERINDICPARSMILSASAFLINSVDNLLQESPHVSAEDETDQVQHNCPTDGLVWFLGRLLQCRCLSEYSCEYSVILSYFSVEVNGVQEKKMHDTTKAETLFQWPPPISRSSS